MEGYAGVRKGTWTQEEDNLLRKCVEIYGEQKWHQVPLRAGLHRCRKSCRLRWLNYLKPNIKRGQFNEDEVDMILRLHKLLGNRWSLIAGRLPGRTANDVKNYWNTHLRSKTVSKATLKTTTTATQNTVKINVIKPQPRTLPKFAMLELGRPKLFEKASWTSSPSSSSLDPPGDNEIMWWDRLLESSEFFQETPTASIMGWSSSDGCAAFCDGKSAEGTLVGSTSCLGSKHCDDNDMDFDEDLWKLLTTEEEHAI